MKIIFKYLIFGWLFMTILLMGLRIPMYLLALLHSKKLATNLILYTFAKIAQRGINKLGMLYHLIKGEDKVAHILKLSTVEDIKANAYNGKMFSDIMLIDPNKNPFGGKRETLSDNLGENERDSNLNEAGEALGKVLDKIDKGHLVNSITEFEN